MILNIGLDIDPITGGLIGSSLQFIGGLATNATNKKIARMNIDAQKAMMRENNQFSRDMAFDMFNAENEYNDPSAQKQRLLAAGLNPWSDGSGSPVETNMADGAAPSSAGSTISPMLPTIVNPFEGMSNIGLNLGNTMKALADARKAGAETRIIEGTAEDLIKQANLQTEAMQLKNAYQDILNKWADKKESATVQQLLSQAFQNSTNSVLNMKNASLVDIEKQVKQETINLIKSETALNDKKKDLLIKDIDSYDVRLALDNLVKKSQAADNYASADDHQASAELKRAQAKTEEDMRDVRRTAQIIQNMKLYNDKLLSDDQLRILNDTKELRLETMIAQLDIPVQERDYLIHKVELARKERKVFWWRFVLDEVQNLLRTGASFLPLTNPGNANTDVKPSIIQTTNYDSAG